jgi:hypothetical protein
MTTDTTEEIAVLGRLAALPPHWMSDELHAAVITAAHASAFAASAAQSLVAARQAVEEAFREQDLTAVNVAASMVTSAEWVIAALPSLSPVHVDGATDVASTELREAVAAMPADPMLP